MLSMPRHRIRWTLLTPTQTLQALKSGRKKGNARNKLTDPPKNIKRSFTNLLVCITMHARVFLYGITFSVKKKDHVTIRYSLLARYRHWTQDFYFQRPFNRKTHYASLVL